MFLEDTLASNAIGGFKVGVGFALRNCRNYMATVDQIQHLEFTAVIVIVFYT